MRRAPGKGTRVYVRTLTPDLQATINSLAEGEHQTVLCIRPLAGPRLILRKLDWGPQGVAPA